MAVFSDLIDCDVHCAPASFDALVPYLSDYWRQYITEAGIRLTDVAHAYPRGAATTASPRARKLGLPVVPATFDALAERVLDDDAAPSPRFVVLNCLTGFETHRNPYFAAAVASALNDWMREEILAGDARLRAGVVVSPVSTDDAVSEIERVGEDPRFVQVLLPIRSDLPWGHKNNHAMFAAASERGLQVGLHAWGRAGKAPTPSGFTTTYLEDYVGNQPIAQAQVLSFVSEGVFERFPELRVVVIECGFAWLPPLLWRFDKDWKGVWREVPWVKHRPSEYVREHFRFTTAPAHLPSDPAVLDQLLEMLDGPGMLLYASDYPHEHGDGLPALLDRLSEEQRRSVLWDTAAELYGLYDRA
ncbi:MAG TPA: amidohydrolase family protein [Solirubrobacteraceae bacterium]|nr:amidohydrolase family protein [Solirubrobacteraceae bacterium]